MKKLFALMLILVAMQAVAMGGREGELSPASSLAAKKKKSPWDKACEQSERLGNGSASERERSRLGRDQGADPDDPCL